MIKIRPTDIPVTDPMPRSQVVAELTARADQLKALGLVGQRTVFASRYGQGWAVFLRGSVPTPRPASVDS